MRKARSVALVSLLFLSFLSAWSGFPVQVQGAKGAATLNILKVFYDAKMGAITSVDNLIDGAIDAATPQLRSLDVPPASPTFGKRPPYWYRPTIAIVTDWASYVDLVTNRVGAIIFNTHGELLPVPCGWTKEAWVDKIAEAMLKRRLTWVNVAGYPFYYSLTDCLPAAETWGEQGFRRLMSHILGDAKASTLSLYPPAGLNFASITQGASGSLYGQLSDAGWKDLTNIHQVEVYRPLKKEDIKNYAILPLYDFISGTTTYWEGAVLAFARTGTRFDAATTEGFGTFIHLGARRTVHVNGYETDADYWRAYAAASAALWVEANQIPSEYRAETSGTGEAGLKVNPVILGTDGDIGTQVRVVRLGFGLYGIQKVTKFGGVTDYPKEVVARVRSPGLSDVKFRANLDLSKAGENVQVKPLEGTYQENEALGLGTDTLLFIAEGFPPTAPFAAAAEGAILFAEWYRTITGMVTIPEQEMIGVESRASEVYFRYAPPLRSDFDSDPNFYYIEYQSYIIVDVYITPTEQDWLNYPVFYTFSATPYNSAGPEVDVGGELTVTIFNGASPTVRIFHEDFENGMEGWSAADLNPGSGYDYWGVDGGIGTGYMGTAWPAGSGTNSIFGEQPNSDVGSYDKEMDAILTYNVESLSLRAYRTVEIRYYLGWLMETGDFVEFLVRDPAGWSVVQTHADNYPAHWEGWTSIDNDAQEIRFRFFSNADSNNNRHLYGVRIYNLEIRGTLPNDASQSADAGNTIDQATSVSVTNGGTVTYYGFLEDVSNIWDPEDWYRFFGTEGYTIRSWLDNLVPGQVFTLELYNSENQLLPCFVSEMEVSCTLPSVGYFMLRIYASSGYGSYRLSIQMNAPSPPPGGGGGGGGGGSVMAGSLITMADGRRVPIQNLDVGDRLQGYNQTNGQIVVVTVTELQQVVVDNLVTIRLVDGTVLRTDNNPLQKFWVKTPDGTESLVGVPYIQTGDYLFNVPLRQWVQVVGKEYISHGQFTMYDIITDAPGMGYLVRDIWDPITCKYCLV